MPDAPLRFCATRTPPCPNKVRGETYCPLCRRQKDRQRGNRHQRGYTNAWARYSERRLHQHQFCVGYPLGYHGAARPLAEVTDHIISMRERPDLAYEPSNHQSLCRECNGRKAAALEGAFGGRGGV